MTLHEAALMGNKALPGVSSEAMKKHVQGLGKVIILKTLWYEDIIERLESSARRYLETMGLGPESVKTIAVPGSFELPLAAKHFIETEKPDFVVTLGCVIQGGTPHFEYICQALSQGLMTVSLEKKIPIGFGVLTVNNYDQAAERATKGSEAAQAALFMSYWMKNNA